MNLIEPPSYTPAQQALFQIQYLHADALRQLADATKRVFATMWHNPEVSRAEMAAALGTNAASAFATHAATVAYLLGRDASLLSPEDYTPPQAYTLHEDGTLTLN